MKNSLVLIVTVMVLSALSLTAQNRFGVEVRANGSFPLEDMGNATLNVGAGSEFIFNANLVSNLGVFVGYGYNKFSADATATLVEMDYEETGYIYGLQFSPTLGESNVALYLRGGGTYNQIGVVDRNDDSVSDTDHGLGWRISVGLDIPFGNNWHLKPAIKYQALSRDIDMESTTFTADYNYFSAGVGIGYSF